MARQGGAQREAKGGGEALGRRVGASAERRAAGRALHGAGDRLCGGGREKQRRGLEEGEKGWFAISENFRDQTVNKQ